MVHSDLKDGNIQKPSSGASQRSIALVASGRAIIKTWLGRHNGGLNVLGQPRVATKNNAGVLPHWQDGNGDSGNFSQRSERVYMRSHPSLIPLRLHNLYTFPTCDLAGSTVL